jgi:uncharacterized protein involved in exopolysaccharide biosynthesis
MAVEDITIPNYPPVEPPRAAPRFTILQALRRHWFIALLPVVLLIGGAVALGLQRKPVYTSESRINVGGLNLTQQSIQGYVTAVQALAVAYARAIDARPVVRKTASKTGVSPTYVLDHVSATPIQGSPVVRIQAKTKNKGEAVRVADAAADSLVAYAIKLNAGRAASKQFLHRYLAASKVLQKINQKRDRAAKKSQTSTVRALNVDSSAAELRMRTAGFLYQQSQAGQATTELVQKLSPAGRAKSDRYSVMQDYAGGAAIAGILIGVGLAVARANAVARRRLRVP